MINFDIAYFEELIPSINSYYAHIPKYEHNGNEAETLAQHSALVMAYTKKMVEAHDLYGIIRRLIGDSIPNTLNNKQLLADLIEKLFWQAVAYHDLGKLNEGFQRNRLNNKTSLFIVNHHFQNQHSVISVYLYLALFYSDFLKLELSDEEQIFICNIALYLSYPIYKHHSSKIEYTQDENNWDNEDLFELSPFLTLFNNPLDEDQIEDFHAFFLGNANFNFLFDRFNEYIFKNENAFPLYALIKLNYSLLTAADYMATAHYLNNWETMLTDFGTLDDKLRRKIINNTRTSKLYNKQVYEAIENGNFFNPYNFKQRNNNNLNILRKCIAIEAILNIRKNNNNSLFYLEAPTGGGKTNISMLAVSELLKNDHSLHKVIYVFPFTTLITQTYQTLIDTFGLDNHELIEMHSNAKSQSGKYEDDYLNYLDGLFMNYPILLMSHIRFFEVLKTNKKELNYLLHRLSNSIVIIDEIQSYSPKIWDKIIYFIVNYSYYFNMKFIIMSATLPKIGEIIDQKKLASDFTYLIKDKHKYFQNPNFSNRVKFDYTLLQWESPRGDLEFYLQNLSEVVTEKSKLFAQKNIMYPDSVYTIVEFIFKRTATEFYEISKNRNTLFDEILLLSGTVLEPRRKQIISKLKSDKTRSKKILLITTQVVEAGVDIDMDLGFKDRSIIDSEEQLAGRINRNAIKPTSMLYIFNCNDEKTLYKDDNRYKIMLEIEDEYESILESKNFDKIYKLVIDKIKKVNRSNYIVNINDLYSAIGTLNFREVNESLRIIDQQNCYVFVPIEIDISLITENIPILQELNIPYSDNLSGKNVWDKYVDIIIQKQKEDFIKNKIKMNKIQSLISLFTFSIYTYSSDYKILCTYSRNGREEYGYLYLESYAEIFTFEDGINTSLLSESNFL